MARRKISENKAANVFEFENVKEIEEEGRYGATIMHIMDEGKSYRVCVRPYDLSNNSIKYKSVNGWLPKDNDGNGITQQFLDTFEGIKTFDDVIGKTCIVEIVFTEDREFANVVGFSKE